MSDILDIIAKNASGVSFTTPELCFKTANYRSLLV